MFKPEQLELPFDDVVINFPREAPKPSPHYDTVEMIETLLDMAQSSQICSIAFVAEYFDGGFAHGFTRSIYENYFSVIGAVDELKAHVRESIYDE